MYVLVMLVLGIVMIDGFVYEYVYVEGQCIYYYFIGYWVGWMIGIVWIYWYWWIIDYGWVVGWYVDCIWLVGFDDDGLWWWWDYWGIGVDGVWCGCIFYLYGVVVCCVDYFEL